MRAVRYDLPLMLAIIGGDPKRFMPYVDLYRRAYAQLGKPVKEIGVHSHGYVAATTKAREELWPDYKRMRDRIGAERGWPPMARERIRRKRSITARSMSARRKRSRGKIAADREGARRCTLRHEIFRRHAVT